MVKIHDALHVRSEAKSKTRPSIFTQVRAPCKEQCRLSNLSLVSRPGSDPAAHQTPTASQSAHHQVENLQKTEPRSTQGVLTESSEPLAYFRHAGCAAPLPARVSPILCEIRQESFSTPQKGHSAASAYLRVLLLGKPRILQSGMTKLGFGCAHNGCSDQASCAI
ncbi:uncharacterized protein B0I36DRAFT_323754 [Microdochium trichocladiopsis]|uniref:Uncharacterized protein n=1 Tax=Microdochium trichocladiopsis TaxID=1682393 RepID=A0A9P8Y538_9PEZI|nr:uncharacterized protein B0I36DRAFT_323754 [Microdochium trichocladiopsis]KAH7031357.1 hypothetical protein B0I36DRAFT_323754 [Microdochium trichocladiopsis]